MNYALTVKDNIITGVHESLSEFTDKTFANSPGFAGQKVTPLVDKSEYREQIDIRCFDKKGKLMPQVWRIEQGYEKLPDGAEIIDGVLVDKETTVEEAPPTLMDEIRGLRAQLAVMETKTAKLDEITTEFESIKAHLVKDDRVSGKLI